MIFVTADSNREQLEGLTKLLVSAFPGSTIYQHVNPLRAPGDVLHNRIAGVFLEAEMEQIGGIELMQMLHRQKPTLSVYILSQTEKYRSKALESGAEGYLVYPISEQQIKEAILKNTQGE